MKYSRIVFLRPRHLGVASLVFIRVCGHGSFVTKRFENSKSVANRQNKMFVSLSASADSHSDKADEMESDVVLPPIRSASNAHKRQKQDFPKIRTKANWKSRGLRQKFSPN